MTTEQYTLLGRMIAEDKPTSAKRAAFFIWKDTGKFRAAEKILDELWDMGAVICLGEFQGYKYGLTNKSQEIFLAANKPLPKLKL